MSLTRLVVSGVQINEDKLVLAIFGEALKDDGGDRESRGVMDGVLEKRKRLSSS